MLPGDFDLRLSIFEGSAPRISDLLLFARLRTPAAGADEGGRNYVILGRDAGGSPPSWVCESSVSAPEAVRLLAFLDSLGLPRRSPRVFADEGLLGDGPYLALEARARGRCGSLNLRLRDAGFSGADSEALRRVLRHLAELTPCGRRPSVVGVIERVVVGRAPAVGPVRARDGARRGLAGAGRPAPEIAFGASVREGALIPVPPVARAADPDRGE